MFHEIIPLVTDVFWFDKSSELFFESKDPVLLHKGVLVELGLTQVKIRKEYFMKVLEAELSVIDVPVTGPVRRVWLVRVDYIFDEVLREKRAIFNLRFTEKHILLLKRVVDIIRLAKTGNILTLSHVIYYHSSCLDHVFKAVFGQVFERFLVLSGDAILHHILFVFFLHRCCRVCRVIALGDLHKGFCWIHREKIPVVAAP